MTHHLPEERRPPFVVADDFLDYVDTSLHPRRQRDGIVEAAGSYNAALDLIHTALRAESEGERYTGVLRRSALAFALRV